MSKLSASRMTYQRKALFSTKCSIFKNNNESNSITKVAMGPF